MNRYAIELLPRLQYELIALDDDDPPHPAYRVSGCIAERYYRARDMWEQSQRELRMIVDGQAPATEGVREDRR